MNFLHFILSILSLFYCSTFANEANLFTTDVYKEISKTEEGNFVISPYSAEALLFFTLFGTRGRTTTELLRALHILGDNNAETKKLDILLLANKMYIEDNFTITDKFKKIASKIFAAESESIDFGDETNAAETINTWVEEITQNRTQNIINSDVLNNKTKLILINALYFQANWSKSINYYESHHLDAKFLEMALEEYEASISFVIPNEKQGLVILEKNIEQVFMPQGLISTKKNLLLPKFTIQSVIDFKKILEKLGVKLLFDKQRADLSGISGRNRKLFISGVYQKCFINVDEGGVEASVSTYDASEASKSDDQLLKDFFSDQSFIFYIKYKGIIIFVGRVNETFN